MATPFKTAGIRRNRFNDGGAFEEMFLRTCECYHAQQVLRLSKVEPPTKVIKDSNNERLRGRRVIFLENPFPDFLGVWTERNGRALMIETKSSMEPVLRIGEGCNLTLKQAEWLCRWHVAGAAVGVVWCYSGHGSVFLPVKQISEAMEAGRRSIKFEEGDVIEQGKGFVLVDFAANLRRWYP